MSAHSEDKAEMDRLLADAVEHPPLRLKPCPHCGEELVLQTDHHGSWWAHRDEAGSDCIHAVTQLHDADDFAAWNRRPILTPAADVEGRARELLAAEYERDGVTKLAAIIRSGDHGKASWETSLRAISAALRSADAPSDEVVCSCGEIAGEDPNCPVHRITFTDADIAIGAKQFALVRSEPGWTDEAAFAAAIEAMGGTVVNDGEGSFQSRVQPWLMTCFGAEIAADRAERNHRFLEESLELVQSLGCTASEAHQLVDYVFGRPIGEPSQEAGGVMVTLAALCLASGLDMHAAGETELARIWTKVEAIQAKQAAKPKHSPLPMIVDDVQGTSIDRQAQEYACANIANFGRGGYLRHVFGDHLAEFAKSVRRGSSNADAQGGADREAIARVIEPEAFGVSRSYPSHQGVRDRALAKADAILALLAGGSER